MNTIMRRRIAYALGVVLGAGIIVELLIALILRPPAAAIADIGAVLALSCVVSVAVAAVGMWLVTARFLSALRARLLGVVACGVVVACVNIVVAALLMFVSHHDFVFLALVTLFSGTVSIAVGSVLAATITDRLDAISTAAATLAAGDYAVRVPLVAADPVDETRTLAHAFNMMAAEVERATVQHAGDEEARRMLIAAVSHDLRTPLAAIRAMIEAITDGVVTEPETVARFHATMGREIRALSTLIDDLFELSQLEAGRLALTLAPAAVPDLIAEVVEGMRAQAAARDVRIGAAVDGIVEPVVIDRPAVRRVLTNLVQNAIRHTPADGTVGITARRVGDGVRVDVVDTGEGIAVEDLPRIFERFYRGERSRSRGTGGAGLGLAIARGLVEAHGGRIWVESVPGRGACFSFVLPVRPVKG